MKMRKYGAEHFGGKPPALDRRYKSTSLCATSRAASRWQISALTLAARLCYTCCLYTGNNLLLGPATRIVNIIDVSTGNAEELYFKRRDMRRGGRFNARFSA